MRAPGPAPEQPTARWAGIAARLGPRRGHEHVPSPVIRLVLVVDLLAAVLATGLVLAFGADRAGPVAVPGVPTDLLLPAMAALVCLGELIHVRLRHGDAVEELALSEAAVAGGVDPWQVVREQLRLSVFMAFGTAALGATTLNVALTAPTLLPFAALPAVALVYAYRKAAQESDERERTTHLIELSAVLAGRLDGAHVVTGFLAAAREAFGADVAAVVLLAGTVPV